MENRVTETDFDADERGLGHSSAASKSQPSLAALPVTVSFTCFPSAAIMDGPGHAVVCRGHTERSLCPQKPMALKRPGSYRTVSQSDGGYEDRTEGDWGKR